MQFGRPEFLNLIWLCVGLALLFRWTGKKRRQRLERFCAPELISKVVSREAESSRDTRSFLLVAAAGTMIFALSQPRWGFHWEDLKQEGVDIIVAIDVSNSMLAEDIKPNRLERAKRKVQDLIQMMEGDRIGLVAFAGTSFVQCPLTLDYSAAQIFLDIIDTGLIPVQGTDLGHAIRTSIKAFDTGEDNSKSLILITDGEDHGGELMKAAEEAREVGVRIFSIGIGQDSGAPIPRIGDGGGFKTGPGGDVVLSKLDEFSLQQVAVLTGGSYVLSVTGDMDLETIYLRDIKKKVEKKEIKTERRQVWVERFQWCLLAALVLLAAEFIMNERRGVRTGPKPSAPTAGLDKRV